MLFSRSGEDLDSEVTPEYDAPHHLQHKTVDPSLLGPGHASPGPYWRTPRTTQDSMSAKPAKAQANVSLSPYDSGELKQSREDVFVFPEIAPQKAPEASFPPHSSTEQHVAPKDTLETIIEGPQEGASDALSPRKRLISESELEVIPEVDFVSVQLESDRLLDS